MASSKIRLYGSTSGYVELEAPAVADDGVLVLPTAADGFGAAGIGSNVVSTTKTDHYTSTSASFVAVTGLSVSVTPTSATSKMLVIAQITFGLGFNAGYGHFKITRGGTDIYKGDATGGHPEAVFGGYSVTDQNEATIGGSIVFLDSPATTSSVTYQVEVRTAGGGNVRINRADSQYSNLTPNGASSITAIEVAA